MDVVEYAEMICNTKIPDWQKEHLRKVFEVSKTNDIRIVMGRHGKVYMYLTPKTLKELSNDGSTTVYQ